VAKDGSRKEVNYTIETSLALIAHAGIATWTELLDYDGVWSPDLLSVGLTAAIERQILEMQAQRLVMNSVIAGLFKNGRAELKKLLQQEGRALKEIGRMRMLHRGIDPEEIEEMEEEDEASMFIRVFSRLGVQPKRG